MNHNNSEYIIRILKKVFSEGTDRYWFDVPAYIKKRDEKALGSELLSRQTGAKADHSRSAKTIHRVDLFCEGEPMNWKDGKDQPITIDTIKQLGMTLCGDEYAFLIPIDPLNPAAQVTMEKVGEAFGKNDLSEIYSLLNNIIYELEDSLFYAYKPGTEEDGEAYYDRRFQEIRRKIDACFWNNPGVREKLYRIVEEEEELVRSFEMPGVPERWIQYNPAIRYFDCVYDFMENSPELYESISKGDCRNQFGAIIHFSFYPTEEEALARKAYFMALQKKAGRASDEEMMDRWYQNELVNTLVAVFEADFGD